MPFGTFRTLAPLCLRLCFIILPLHYITPCTCYPIDCTGITARVADCNRIPRYKLLNDKKRRVRLLVRTLQRRAYSHYEVVNCVHNIYEAPIYYLDPSPSTSFGRFHFPQRFDMPNSLMPFLILHSTMLNLHEICISLVLYPSFHALRILPCFLCSDSLCFLHRSSFIGSRIISERRYSGVNEPSSLHTTRLALFPIQSMLFRFADLLACDNLVCERVFLGWFQ